MWADLDLGEVTTNPVESNFATVRRRRKRNRNFGSRDTTRAMVFKLFQSA